MDKLLIVESPTKAKTIKKFLGKDFPVVSSMGHVRDLPKSKLGVDVEKDFEPVYETIRGKGKVIKQIKRELKGMKGIVMATDPDREGEAIAWHLVTALDLSDDKVDRIVFHEITKSAVEKAFKDPKKIDIDRVDAQQARRILDRLVGYKLSPFLWKKIRYGLSAGRVQSVAVRLIVDRERERDAFDSRVYWKVYSFVSNKAAEDGVEKLAITEDTPRGIKKDRFGEASKDGALWKFELLGDRGKTELETGLKGKKAKKWVDELLEKLPDKMEVEKVKEAEGKNSPPPPFVTSTLQRAAFSKLGFSAKRTMTIAQRLYEAGFITYMRTDSVFLSGNALAGARKWIEGTLGKEYLPEKPRRYRTKTKAAQEAHEAIRPTSFGTDQEALPKRFDKAHRKLYGMIRRRALASQCEAARVKRWTVESTCGKGDDTKKLRAKNSQLIFDGFYKVAGVPKPLQVKKTFVPVEGDVLDVHLWAGVEGHTPPPPRYTEASLVKELEKNGIGRPSTYASIIDTIIKRGYVKREERALAPTDSGYVVNDLLVEHFPDIVDLKFTAAMETDLDEIAEGKEKWKEVIGRFYKPFISNLEKKQEEVKKEDIVIMGDSDEKCPECGGPMVIRLGRYGKFLSCKKFPDCKGMKNLAEDAEDEKFWEKYEEVKKCEKCGGPMTLKTGRFGKFWACEKYPDCKSTKPLILKEKCPECGANLVERKARRGGRTFIGCSAYPKCKYIQKKKKK